MKRVLLWLGAAIIFTTPCVRADTIFYLTSDGCSGTCGTAPFGMIDLQQTNSTTITGTFTLSSNEAFANTGAGGDTALAFSVSGAAPTVTILSTSVPLASDYTVGGAVSLPKYGDFDISILCAGCAKGGKITNPAGPIDFTITRASGISISDFILSSDGKPGAYFASDILGNNGKTGIVAALEPAAETPEPSYQLITLGLLGFAGWFGRRRMARTA